MPRLQKIKQYFNPLSLLSKHNLESSWQKEDRLTIKSIIQIGAVILSICYPLHYYAVDVPMGNADWTFFLLRNVPAGFGVMFFLLTFTAWYSQVKYYRFPLIIGSILCSFTATLGIYLEPRFDYVFSIGIAFGGSLALNSSIMSTWFMYLTNLLLQYPLLYVVYSDQPGNKMQLLTSAYLICFGVLGLVRGSFYTKIVGFIARQLLSLEKRKTEQALIDLSLESAEKDKARQERDDLQEKSFNAAKLSLLGEMAGGIAHEINNPLAVISGYTQLLRDPLHAEKGVGEKLIQDSLAKVDFSCNRIKEIVSGLRSYCSQSEHDSIERISVASIAEKALLFCRERFKQEQVDLTLANKLEKEVFIECRPNEIVQALLNVLQNAYESAEKSQEKLIDLIIEKDQESVYLKIKNSGDPINHELREKIFYPFFTTKPIGSGTGLGLSIAKNLAESNRGELYLQDRNKTCFVFKFLPV